MIKKDEHKLPANTIDIIDFNKVVIKENEQIKIVDISDSSNYETDYGFTIPTNKNYHSIQHGRYVILEDRNAKHYFQSVFDIYTKELVDLQEPEGSVGAARVAQKDRAILYNVDYGGITFDKKYRKKLEPKRQVKLKTFAGESKVVVDSVMGSLWSPNEQWFLGSKYLRREGRNLKWERALFNREGQKIILPSNASTISQAVWSKNGILLAIPHHQTLSVFEIEWKYDSPTIKNFTNKSPFSAPILFSPDGKYILYVKYYEDGHSIFGNDIVLTDNKLNFIEPIIEHNNLTEIPVNWTNEGLITQDGMTVESSKYIYMYQIKYK
jgi:hypothetical protein